MTYNPLWSDIYDKIGEDELIMKWKNPLLEYVNKGSLTTTPLTRAIQNGWTKVVVWLIKNGADVNKEDGAGDTPLAEAVRCGDVKMFKLLLDYGADVTANNWSILRRLNIVFVKIFVGLNDGYINIMMEHALRKDNLAIIRYLHIERIKFITMIFIDLPQYIILWITDWLPGSERLTEYEKVGFIEAVQKSVQKVKNIETY